MQERKLPTPGSIQGRRPQVASHVNVQLTGLAERIAALKAERLRLEGQMQSLGEQRTAAEERCRTLGVEPDELDSMIELKSESLSNVLQSMEGAVSDIEFRRDEVQRVRDTGRETVGS